MQANVQEALLADPDGVEDVVATGIGEIEDLSDGSFRFTLYRSHWVDGREVHVVAARIIVHTRDLPVILHVAASHVGLALMRAPKFVRWTVH